MKLISLFSATTKPNPANRWHLLKAYCLQRSYQFAQRLNRRTQRWTGRQQKGFALLVVLTGGFSSLLVLRLSFTTGVPFPVPSSRLGSPALILPDSRLTYPLTATAGWETILTYQRRLDSLKRLDTLSAPTQIKK